MRAQTDTSARRSFLRALGSLGTATLGNMAGLAFLSTGCDTGAPPSCPPSALTPEEEALRQRLGYLDESKNPNALCQNCSYFKPASSSAQCGECTSLPGLIHPRGTCKIFRKKA